MCTVLVLSNKASGVVVGPTLTVQLLHQHIIEDAPGVQYPGLLYYVVPRSDLRTNFGNAIRCCANCQKRTVYEEMNIPKLFQLHLGWEA